MKNLLKCQEMLTIQQEIYWIICIIKVIKNSLHRFNKTKNTIIPNQIYFTGKTEGDDGAKMILIAEKQHKTILFFSLNSLNLKE